MVCVCETPFVKCHGVNCVWLSTSKIDVTCQDKGGIACLMTVW